MEKGIRNSQHSVRLLGCLPKVNFGSGRNP